MKKKMRNKRIGVSFVFAMTLSLLVIATAIPSGAQPTVTVSIIPDDITLAPQTSATLSIMITDVPENNVSGAIINLTYDPTVVQVTAVGGSDFDYFDYNIVNGKVRMIGFQNGGANLYAPIKFADVTVKAIGNPGDCSPANLEIDEDAGLEMGTGSPYNLQLHNGSVCIVQGVPVFNTFGLIALIGLLVLVLAVTVKKR